MKKYKCKKCEFQAETVSEIANHVRWKHCEKESQFECECGKIFKQKGSFISHRKLCNGQPKNKIWICPKCNFEIKTRRQKHLDSCDGFGTRRYKNPNPTKYGTLEYKEKMSRVSSKMLSNPEIKKKLSISSKKYFENLTEKERKIFADKISKAVKGKTGGIRLGGGRGKKGWYKGYWCDSSWELAYVIYNLEHDIKFERNKEGFEYIFEEEIHKYYPDFILEDGLYIEVKGYITKQVEEKIKQFPYELKVLQLKEMKIYLNYTESKYGKDFVKLYGVRN